MANSTFSPISTQGIPSNTTLPRNGGKAGAGTSSTATATLPRHFHDASATWIAL